MYEHTLREIVTRICYSYHYSSSAIAHTADFLQEVVIVCKTASGWLSMMSKGCMLWSGYCINIALYVSTVAGGAMYYNV